VRPFPNAAGRHDDRAALPARMPRFGMADKWNLLARRRLRGSLRASTMIGRSPCRSSDRPLHSARGEHAAGIPPTGAQEVRRTMSIWRQSLMDLPTGASGGRVLWADIAKAFSMILLVAWTLIGDKFFVNEMLIFLRMPLFFFVSGLFAWRMITRTSFSDLMRDKVLNFLYLYVLWETLLFLLRNVPQHFLHGRSLSFAHQLSLLWEPIFNIWFLYALALAFLVAWLLRRVPAWIVLVAAVALYLASVASGEWRFLGFVERLVRLFPFFWLGLMVRPMAGRFVDANYRFWPLPAAVFLVAAYFVYDPRWLGIGVLTFSVSLVGIVALLLFARQLAELSPVARVLAIVGGSTLYIYVMHKIVIFYLEVAMNNAGLVFPARDFVLLPVVVAVCTIAGRWMAREPAFAWLLGAPWLRARPRNPVGVVPAE
jgi:uncharacterized membrane protein YcfT